jgi:hypothetical protein
MFNLDVPVYLYFLELWNICMLVGAELASPTWGGQIEKKKNLQGPKLEKLKN